MIITQEKNKRVVESHDFDSVNCTIDAEDMRYVASLLRNNYSNPSLAVVREISANALDANLEAGVSRPIEITVPSKFNAHFVVRDFGGGLSQEDVFGLYSKYGKSTKRTSNNYIGAFGIGKFAPLSYGNNFTVVSFFGGHKTSYNVFVNEDDDTKIVKLASEPSSEPTGLSVEVAIADDDVDTFVQVIKNFFRFFSDEEMPRLIGVGEDEKFFDDYEIVMEAEDGSWFIIDDKQDYWHKSHHDSHALMGRVCYPLNGTAINFSSFTEEGDDTAHHLNQLIGQDNIYIRFDIGQLKLHHSRESLEYNKQTQKEIYDVLLKVRNDIEEIAKEKLGNAEDLWDAKTKYAQVINALPSSLRNIFVDSFEWDGTKISSMTIDRDYRFQDTLIITEYWKEDDADATDGYKMRSSKTTRIYPSNTHKLVIQDLKSVHGNALRARTLFKEDEKLEKVFVVNAQDDKAEEYLFAEDGMQFGKINSERFLYTSLIEKAQLQSRGKAVSGESRADVPLFELDVDGTNRWKRRNADYWLNCNDNIDDLELRASDPDDRGVIYVPIANYKVVNEVGGGQEECISLDSLMRDVQGIRNIQKSLAEEESEFEFPLVVGVRRKDCKKLTKSRWTGWAEYKKSFAKSYLLDNLDKVVNSEKAMAFKENRVSMNHYGQLSSLLENSKFRECMKSLGKTHLLMQVFDDLKLMTEECSELDTIFRMINFLRGEDEEWVKENIPSTYKIDAFDNNCLEISVKYPLLVNINAEVYAWQEYSTLNFGKNILQYIELCDWGRMEGIV